MAMEVVLSLPPLRFSDHRTRSVNRSVRHRAQSSSAAQRYKRQLGRSRLAARWDPGLAKARDFRGGRRQDEQREQIGDGWSGEKLGGRGSSLSSRRARSPMAFWSLWGKDWNKVQMKEIKFMRKWWDQRWGSPPFLWPYETCVERFLPDYDRVQSMYTPGFKV
jgi:hypothetical protein